MQSGRTGVPTGAPKPLKLFFFINVATVQQKLPPVFLTDRKEHERKIVGYIFNVATGFIEPNKINVRLITGMYLIFLTKPGEQENRIFMACMSQKERLTALQSQFSNILRTCGIFSTMTYPVNHDRIVSGFSIQPTDYDLMMFNEAVELFLGFGEGLECQNLYWNRFFEFRSCSNKGPRRPGFDFNHQFPEDFFQFLG